MKLSLAYLLKERLYGTYVALSKYSQEPKKLFDYESKNHLQFISLK